MERKLYICAHCGNIIEMVKDKGVPVMCCGQKMDALVANTVDAAKEKHIPVCVVENNTVKVTVGEVEHPMLAEHYIEWIELVTENGVFRKYLAAGQAPKACFAVCGDDKVKSVYAYCNLHGLWKADI